jgi:hypothetical protein
MPFILTSWRRRGTLAAAVAAAALAGAAPAHASSLSNPYACAPSPTLSQAFAAGSHSLSLPASASAVSAPICIDPTYPFYRLVARNTGDRSSTLRMEVLFYDAHGKVQSTKSLDYRAASTYWAPTGAAPISVFTAKTTVSAAPIALRFTPQGNNGRWQIDDVFVDPYMRR